MAGNWTEITLTAFPEPASKGQALTIKYAVKNYTTFGAYIKYYVVIAGVRYGEKIQLLSGGESASFSISSYPMPDSDLQVGGYAEVLMENWYLDEAVDLVVHLALPPPPLPVATFSNLQISYAKV